MIIFGFPCTRFLVVMPQNGDTHRCICVQRALGFVFPVDRSRFCRESWRHIDLFPRRSSRWTLKFLWEKMEAGFKRDFGDRLSGGSLAAALFIHVGTTCCLWRSCGGKSTFNMTLLRGRDANVLVCLHVMAALVLVRFLESARRVSRMSLCVLSSRASCRLCNGEPPSAQRCSCCWGF